MVRARWWSLLLPLLAAAPAAAQPRVVAGTSQPGTPTAAQPAAKLLDDEYQVAYLDGQHAGYARMTVQEVMRQDGTPVIRAMREMRLTMKRFGDTSTTHAITGTDELSDGRVLGVFIQQKLGNNVNQVVRGAVQGQQLHVTADGPFAKFNKDIPWDPQVVGILGETKLVEARKPQQGARFDYRIYEPTVNNIVTIRCTVDGFEELKVAGQKPKLLKVTATPDPIQDVQLPASTFWYDSQFKLVRVDTRMPGMGRVTFERSTKEAATRPVDVSRLKDVGFTQSVMLKRAILQPHDASVILYKVTLPVDPKPETAFALDGRQSVRDVNPKAHSFTLEVKAQQPPAFVAPGAPAAGPEFLESNYFITSDDANVRRHTQAAVGAETDPWKKCLRIERWVHTNMKVMNFTEAMAPAFEVARNLTGDCTEYSMLTAAMCRAAGVPSRTAIGLVYADGRAGPMFGFHMWTEVYVNGQWVGIDATLGKGRVGPAHLKVSDHSWHDMRSMTPILPLMRVMLGEPAIEILHVGEAK
jgi:transglutaminase-like putative cysteine protease